MNNPKVSVIVPVYNVYEYLSRCIESIINQTYNNLEIILIDDGSNDGSEKICDIYKNHDTRVIVIHKKNGGQSEARNVGLDISSGDFIVFVDSDDFIDTNYVSFLLNIAIENNVEIVQCSYIRVNNFEKNVSQAEFSFSDINVINSANIFFSYYKNIITSIVWDKIFSKHLFDSIRFPEGQTMEDAYILFDILDKVDTNVVISRKQLYYYCIRKNSTMTGKLPVNHFISTYKVCERRLFYAEQKNDKILIEIALDTMLSNYFRCYQLSFRGRFLEVKNLYYDITKNHFEKYKNKFKKRKMYYLIKVLNQYPSLSQYL